MPTQRYTQAARRRDERILELLLSGFTPEQVAALVQLSVREVLAAHERIQESHRALGPEEAANRQTLLMFRAIYMQSMQAWQRSILPVEVVSEAKTDKPAERQTIHPLGDGRHLDRALRAAIAERKLRAGWTPQGDAAPAATPNAATPNAAKPAKPAARPTPPTDEPLPLPRGKAFPPIPKNTIADVCSRAFHECASLAGSP